MMKVSVRQPKRDVEKYGKRKAKWAALWRQNGHQRSKWFNSGTAGREAAEKFAKDLQAKHQLNQIKDGAVSWQAARNEFLENKAGKVTRGKLTQHSYDVIVNSLNAFERIAKPKFIGDIDYQTIERFKSARLKEPGVKRGSTIQPATLNVDLAEIKSLLLYAQKVGWISIPPIIEREDVDGRDVRIIPEHHLGAIYRACEIAVCPDGQPYDPTDWWRGFLVFMLMTGWRAASVLKLRREDVDLEGCTAISRAKNTKGRRVVHTPLHPDLVEHLKRLRGFTPEMFPWTLDHSALWRHFDKIQEHAGIRLPCRLEYEHECTLSCHTYTPHDLKRTCCTMNAARLSPHEFLALTQHTDPKMHRYYVDLNQQIQRTASKQWTPNLKSDEQVVCKVKKA
jgi:integrase